MYAEWNEISQCFDKTWRATAVDYVPTPPLLPPSTVMSAHDKRFLCELSMGMDSSVSLKGKFICEKWL